MSSPSVNTLNARNLTNVSIHFYFLIGDAMDANYFYTFTNSYFILYKKTAELLYTIAKQFALTLTFFSL